MKHQPHLKKLLARWLHPWHWPCVTGVSVQQDPGGLTAKVDIDTTKHMGLAGTSFTIAGSYLEIVTACQPITYVPLERFVPFLLDRSVITPISPDQLKTVAVHLPGDGIQRNRPTGVFLEELFKRHAGWIALWVPDAHVADPEPHLMLSVWGRHDSGLSIGDLPPTGIHVPFDKLTGDMEGSDEWMEVVIADPVHGFYDYVVGRPYHLEVDVAAQTYAQRCVETVTQATIWDGLHMDDSYQTLIRGILEKAADQQQSDETAETAQAQKTLLDRFAERGELTPEEHTELNAHSAKLIHLRDATFPGPDEQIEDLADRADITPDEIRKALFGGLARADGEDT